MDAQSEARVKDLARKLGAAVEEVFVCRRPLFAPFDPNRDQVMISFPAGLWSGWEVVAGPGTSMMRLRGRLHPWHDLGGLTVDTETGHSEALNRIVTQIKMEIPALVEGDLPMLAHYADDPATDGNKRTLEFIQSCIRRRQASS